MLVRKAIAFIKRDYIIESSYKLAFVFELLTTFFPLVSFYFIGRLVGSQADSRLARYGGQYFPFALVGVAFSQYLLLALGTFSRTVRRTQMAGCLEATLSTQTSPQAVVILSSLYCFGTKLLHILLVFVLGWLVFRVDYGKANFLSASVVLLLTAAAFSGLGILSAALIVVLKKGDPIEWMFGAASSLLGGAVFPVEVMPRWMQCVAVIFPITYSLEAMRMAILRGYSVIMLWKPLAILAAMAAVLVPLGVWAFAAAVEKGRRDGSLMHY
jgi:ABC-2 type transport system permease protein